MKLIVGLGNPGRKYEQTRHNIGFTVADKVAVLTSAGSGKVKFEGELAEASVGGEKLAILCPHTYMNASGQSVRKALDFYKLELEDILVVCDDLNLDSGRLRIRPSGSAGGQNGIKDIIRHLGSDAFARLRVGIGRPPDGWTVTDYVLGKFSKPEHETFEAATTEAAHAAMLRRCRTIPAVIAVALAHLLLAPAASAAIAAGELADLAAQLQYAWYTEASSDLVALAERLEDEKPRGDIEPWLRYYSAYGYYRAAMLAEDEYFGEYVERCESLSRRLVRADPEFVEALILRGSCAALLAARRPVSAVLAPSRAIKSFTKAARLAPDNPRLLLQQAVAVMQRPGLRDEFAPVSNLLDAAVAGFERLITADPLAPDWGEAEANTAIATLAIDEGQKKRARDALEQALQIVPDYRAAQRLLATLRAGR